MIFAAISGGPIEQALVWAVPFGGIAQLALVWWAAARAGYRIIPRMPKMTPELKRLAIIAAPAALAGGVVLTTVTDVVGFFSFLGLGTLFLT